ncbi:MAG: decarboxylase [Candidatus Margulisiibacteriota bacterium]
MPNPILQDNGKELLIAGYPLEFWEKNYELPVHIYSAAIIRQNLRAFKSVFQKHYPKFRICFAAKACTHLLVLNIAREEGAGADVASYNEVRCALDAGMAPSMLDLNGNCKEDWLIEDAIKKGMNIICDGFEEYALVDQIAGKLKQKTNVVLRVSGYELEAVTDDSVFTAGVWTKFGASIDLIPEFLNQLDRYPNVELIGFHTHIGSQIAKISPYLSVLGKLIELGHKLQAKGKNCRIINIGGGFPVSYVDKQYWDRVVEKIKAGYLAAGRGDNSQIFVWHDGLAGFFLEGDAKVHLDRWTGERFYTEFPKEKMLEQVLTREIMVNGKKLLSTEALKQLGTPLLTIEPGRSVVEDAGVTLSKVGIVKKIAQHHNLVCLEMGITSHGESLIEKPVKRWEIVNDYQRKDAQPFEAFVGGNLCFSGDMISKYKVFFQREPKRGETIVIHNTGAYTSSLFSANSNCFPRPARVLVGEDGKARLIKKRDAYADIIYGKNT